MTPREYIVEQTFPVCIPEYHTPTVEPIEEKQYQCREKYADRHIKPHRNL